MAYDPRSLDDYIDVAQRIADFRERYPDGTLQPADPARPWEQAAVNGIAKDGKPYAVTMIVYAAAAYRTPDDPRPGIGVAWEVFPGRTPYTLGSELMNAETSAWGRAIIAVGASDSRKGVASREEVRNRRAERDDGLPVNRDGSLSRSRTTDEEKQAAGVMTSAQQAEHTALQPKKAEVSRGLANGEAVDDVWAGTRPPVDEISQDSPGTISRQQQASMHAHFNALGVRDRGKRLEWTRRALGLDALASSTNLSYRQAGDLLVKLDEAARTGAKT